jgi:hypothetical protein
VTTSAFDNDLGRQLKIPPITAHILTGMFRSLCATQQGSEDTFRRDRVHRLGYF